MARVEYTDGSGDPAVTARIEARRGGTLTNLDRLLLHSPPVANGWNELLGAVRGATTLDPLLRELIVLRVAVLNRADYEFAAHEGPARQAGAGDDWLAAVADWEASRLFSAEERCVLAYTDAVTRQVEVDDELFAELAGRFDSRRVVEITVTAAVYNAVSRFLVALQVTR